MIPRAKFYFRRYRRNVSKDLLFSSTYTFGDTAKSEFLHFTIECGNFVIFNRNAKMGKKHCTFSTISQKVFEVEKYTISQFIS